MRQVAQARCVERKANWHVNDFGCNKASNHPDPHSDPATGTPWKHPKTPYGMHGPEPKNGPRGKTKHGCYYSAKPVKGYGSSASPGR